MALTITSGDIQKIKETINEGVRVNNDIISMREGLRDSVADTAKQLNIKPKILNTAIKHALKDSFNESKEELADIETILIQAGYGGNIASDATNTDTDSMIGHNSQQAGDDVEEK